MTDVDFMTISEHANSKFALVHFDGPHMTTDVIAEAVWFAQRSAPVTRFIFDDYPKYNLTLDCVMSLNGGDLEQLNEDQTKHY